MLQIHIAVRCRITTIVRRWRSCFGPLTMTAWLSDQVGWRAPAGLICIIYKSGMSAAVAAAIHSPWMYPETRERYFIPWTVAVDEYVSWKPIRRFNKPSAVASTELRRESKERYTWSRLREVEGEKVRESKKQIGKNKRLYHCHRCATTKAIDWSPLTDNRIKTRGGQSWLNSAAAEKVNCTNMHWCGRSL